MNQLSYNYLLIKQGQGNTFKFNLNDINDNIRTLLYSYTLSTKTIKSWGLTIDNWFYSASDLNPFMTYHLCLQIPNSQKFMGSVQNFNTLFGSYIVVASSEVTKNQTNSIPSINYSSPTEFKFIKLSNQWNTDLLTFTIIDQAGNVASANSTIKLFINYKEYFNN